MTFSAGSILLLACGVALNHFRRSAAQLRSEVQRLAAEEARFHEGDSRYRAIFETAPVGCVVWEPGFIIIDWNQQAEKMFGWSRADILGRNLIDTLVHEKDRAAVLQQSVSLFADGQTNHATLQHTTRDGVSIICEWHHAVLRDAEGTPIRGVSLCVDVTPHQALTRDLRTRERYQRTLLDSFPFMVWLKDTESRFLAVNQTLADIVGADTPDTLIGQNAADYFPAELAQTHHTADRDVMRDGLKKVVEEQLEVHGEQRWFETGKAPVIDTDGQWLGTVGYSRDITERKLREAQLRELQAAAVRTQEARRYREVFDNASDAIFVLDVGPESQMTLSGINPAAELALGWPSARLQGQRLDDIAHGQLGEGTGQAFADGLGHFKTCLATGMPTSYEGRLNLRPGLEADTYQIALTPLADDLGIVRIIAIASNITQRKRYEQALLDRIALEDRITRLAQHVPGYLYVGKLDADGRLSTLYSSDGIQQIYGISPAEAMADTQSLLSRIHPDDREPARLAMLASARALVPLDIQHRVLPGDGRTLWVHAKAQPTQTEDGSILWHGITIDITERRQLEEQLHQREQMFRALAENSPSPIYRVGRDGRRLYANPVVAQITGIPLEELIGSTPADGRIVAPEYVAVTMNAVRAVFDTGKNQTFEVQYITHDGGRRDYQMLLVPERDASGEVASLLAMAHDISAIKEAQAHMSRFIANAPGFVYTMRCDAAGHVSLPFVSPGFEAKFGVTPDTVCADIAPLREVYHPDDRARVQAAFDTSAAQLTPVCVEFRAYHPENGEFWIESRAMPMRQADGAIHWHGFGLDITERKHLEEALRRREREFRSLAENMPDNVARWDPEGRYLYLNPVHARTLGVSMGECLGKLIPDTHEHVKAAIAQVVTTRQAVQAVQQTVPVAGVIEIHDVSLVPEFDEAGHVTSVLAIGRDMTNIYRMQEALAAREREFRSLATNLPSAVVRWDRAGRYIYVNAAYERMRHTTAAAVVGKRISEAFPDKGDNSPADMGIARVLETGEPLLIAQQSILGTNGETRIHEVLLVPERDAQGEIVSVLGVGQDVTERLQYEATLLQRAQLQEQFASVAQAVPGFLFSLRSEADNRAYFPFASAGIADLFGLQPEDIRADAAVLRARYHPDDLPRFFDAVAVSQENLTPFSMEMRVNHPAKGLRWIESRSIPHRRPDGATEWHGLMIDITERKQAQQRLELLEHAIDLTSDAIYLINESLRFGYVNAAACRALGYSHEELLAMGPLDIDPDIDAQAARHMMETASTESRIHFETRHRTRDGRIFPVELNGTHFVRDGARFSISVVRDITERKRIESTLRFIADPGHESDFLTALARHLGETLGVEYVVIDRLADEPGIAETVALHVHGAPAPNMRYALAGTPCANVLGKSSCSYPHGVQALFPQGSMLVDMSVDSYAGISLLDSTGKPVGLIAVMRTAPMQDEAAILQILRIVAPRAAAELERAESGRLLRAREQAFRTLAENLPVAVIRYDTEQRRRYLNPAAERMLHGSAAELLGRVPGGPTVPATAGMLAHYRSEMDKVLEADAARELEFVLDALPIEQREHYEIRFVPEHGADGNPTGVLAIWYDISERKRMENELRRRGEEFRAAVENSPDPIFRYDREGRRLYANKAALDLPRQPGPALLGATPKEVRLVPDADAENILACIRTAVQTRQESQCEVGFITPEGRRHVFQSRYVPEFGPDGEVASVLALARDITPLSALIAALHAKEFRLAEAQRIAHVGSWELDIANNALSWSDEIFRIFEIDRTRFGASYEAFLDAVHPDDREMVHQSYLASLKNRRPYEIEHRLLMSDGRVKHVLERGESIFDADGRPLRSAGTVQDITERKNTEVLLEQSRALQRELITHREETLEEERKRIARELHEELGQVLTALRMNISMLRVRYGDIVPPLLEKTQSMIGLVDRAISSMREVVTTLRPSSLDAGIMAALEWLASDVQKHTGIECQLTIDEPLELSDERSTALFRIVQEALTNAARHAHATRVEIRLERHGQQWQVRVADNGRGFNPGDAFPRSYGLLGMRERARVLDGELDIRSTPGQGTQIRLVFPAHGDEGFAT